MHGCGAAAKYSGINNILRSTIPIPRNLLEDHPNQSAGDGLSSIAITAQPAGQLRHDRLALLHIRLIKQCEVVHADKSQTNYSSQTVCFATKDEQTSSLDDRPSPGYPQLCTESVFRCSKNTSMDTSSVKIISPAPDAVACVELGFSLTSRNRDWLRPATVKLSASTTRGTGNLLPAIRLAAS